MCMHTFLSECACTGNQGFYDSGGSLHVPGSSVVRPGYFYPANTGGYCNQTGEPWCFISCDTRVCPNVSRYPSHTLWAADLYHVPLCFSFDACGGSANQIGLRTRECAKRGGYMKDGYCSCDVGLPCEGDQQHRVKSTYKANSTSWVPWVRWTLGCSCFCCRVYPAPCHIIIDIASTTRSS